MTKKIEYIDDAEIELHHLAVKIPKLHSEYGLWIINASLNVRSPINSFNSCRQRQFEFYSLSHLIDGKGCLALEKEESIINAGDAVLITPGALNRYGGYDGHAYTEDSVRFCGRLADSLFDNMLLKPGKYYFGIVRKIMTLAEIIQDPASDAQINASIFLQQILMELHNQAKFDQQFASPIEQLLKLIKSRPEHWWTVRELAETCNISDDQLRRNFIQYSGVLPKQYIEEFKLRRAAEMLISCPLTVTKIANSFGYMDAYHFSRRFKLLFGISPEIYRKRFNLAN